MKTFFFAFGFLCAACLGAETPDSLASIYQISTMNALHAGVFDAEYTYQDVMQKGSLGLGVIDGLKGEMVAVDGHFYHIETSGKAGKINPTDTCPYARVVQFNPENHFIMRKEKGFSHITKRLLQQFPSHNNFYALKIQGVFPRVKIRVLREQKPPFNTLEEAKKDQNEFTLYDVKGTVVGFFTPRYLAPTFDNQFDFGFISSDGKTGGHILDFSIENVNVLIQPIFRTELVLPSHMTFQRASISE